MAGSHEVRGSIPLGSTTDTRGARRRRRAPLFCFRAHRTERAYRTKSVSHSGASARAGAPFSFARTRRPIQAPGRKGASSPLMGIVKSGCARLRRARGGRAGPVRAHRGDSQQGGDAFGAWPPRPRRVRRGRLAQGRQTPEGGANAVDGIGADSDSAAAGSRTPASAACRRRSTSGGPSPAGAARAATPPSSPPAGPRRRGSPIGGRPPASAGSAASPTHASGGAAGRGRIRRWAAWAPRGSGTRDCPREKCLAGRRGSAAGSDAPSSPAISEAPSPSARRRLIYEMVGMPTISLPASLGRLPKQRPKRANRGEWPAPLPMRRKKRRGRRSFHLVNP